MRDLKKDAGAITGARIATLRPAMGQRLQYLQALLDDPMRALPFDIDDKPDPARIFFVLRIIQPLFGRKPWYIHDTCTHLEAGNDRREEAPRTGTLKLPNDHGNCYHSIGE